MGEEVIYYRGGAGKEFANDPATLNLDELPTVLAMAGWAVHINFAEVEGGPIGLSLTDMGGSKGMSDTEIALSLKMVDRESGELLAGYSVSDESGRIQVKYSGVADLRFAEFVKALSELS